MQAACNYMKWNLEPKEKTSKLFSEEIFMFNIQQHTYILRYVRNIDAPKGIT